MRRSIFVFALAALACAGTLPAGAQPPTTIAVDGRVALASLASLCDAQLRTVLDGLQTLAATPAAQQARWSELAAPLRALTAGLPVPVVAWFARPDGSYWTAQAGRQRNTLADRPYFARLLHGSTVVGDLIASRSTGQPAAVVAVPIRNARGRTIGALGASVPLAALSSVLKREMDLGPRSIFFSLDRHGVVGISVYRALQLRHFDAITPEFHDAFTTMLKTTHGTVTYTLHGVRRTVIYRTSAFTGWRYAFGTVATPGK